MFIKEPAHLLLIVLILGFLALYVGGLVWTILTAPKKGQNLAGFIVFYIFFPLIAFIVLLISKPAKQFPLNGNYAPQ